MMCIRAFTIFISLIFFKFFVGVLCSMVLLQVLVLPRVLPKIHVPSTKPKTELQEAGDGRRPVAGQARTRGRKKQSVGLPEAGCNSF